MRLRLLLVAALLVSLNGPADAGIVPPKLREAFKKTTRTVSRTVSRFTLASTARARMGLDGLEAKLEAHGLDGAARMLNGTRRVTRPYSLGAIGSFVGARMKARPQLVKGFLAWRVPFDVVRIAALPALPLGVGPALFAATGLPLDLAYFIVGEHVLRRREAPPGQKPSFLSTLKQIRDEYREHLADRERKIAVAIRAAQKDGLAIATASP